MYTDLKHFYHGLLKNHKLAELALKKHDIGGFLFWKICKNQADYIMSLKENDDCFIHYIVPASSHRELEIAVQYYKNHPLDCHPLKMKLKKGVHKDVKDLSRLESSEKENDFQQSTSLWCVTAAEPKDKTFTFETLALDDNVGEAPTACHVIRNAGFDDVFSEDSDSKSNESSILPFNNNTDMKLPRGDSRCQIFLANTFMKSKVNLSFIRKVLQNWKKQSTSCSTDSGIDGYYAFPIDDDIFDVSSGEVASNDVFVFDRPPRNDANQTKRTNVLNATNSIPHTKTEQDAPCRESVADRSTYSVHIRSKTGQTSKSGLSRNLQRPISCIASFENSEKCETNKSATANCNMRYNNKTQNSPTRNSQSPKRKSYYVAADEISPDLDILDFAKSSSTDPSHNSDGSSTPSNGSSLFQSSPCLPNSRVYDAWAEVGAEGGVVQIPGSGTSLHFLPNLKLNDTEKHLLKQKSMSTLDLHRTIKNSAGNSKPEDNIDGRVFIGLEDPPDHLNNDTRIIVGPMVRVDYGNYGIMSSGAVLQIDVNATVKSSVENDSTICEFTCLRSNSTDGEFKEIKGSYYHYGNTLQVSISPDITDQMTRIPGNGGSMCLVPVVKLSKGALLTEPSISVWDKISTKTFWVGIYGPKRPHQASTCCVSISSASTSPPTLWIKKSSKNMFMHLWSSYQVALQKPQEIQILIQPEPSSSAIVASCLQDEDDLIGENEIRTKSRINRLFTIKYPKEVKRPLRERNSSESDSSLNYSCEKQNNYKDKLTLSIVGVHSKNILNEICFVVPKRASSCSTPIKRWKRTICSAPPKSIQGGRVQDYMYLWHEAQREAKTKLQPISKIPGADRRISITRVAVAITSRTRSKSVSGIAPHLAQYSQSDIMPILSMNTLWAHGTNHYKEWYVGVSQGKVGLIHTKCVRVFDTDQCYDGMEGRISVSELVENIIEPVGSLKYDYASFREKLLEHVDDWTIFGSNLQFGENYITRVCRGMKDDSKRETRDKLSLFLERYKDYCDTGPRKRLFHKEIIRTLLYMEQYDLVTSLIADFCFLTLSTEIGERWGGLLTILDGTKSLCRGNDVTNGKWRSKSLSEKKKSQHKKSGAVTCDKEIDRTKQNICKQAIKYLSIWRQQFNNNHIKELINLHHAVDELEESPNRTSRFLTSAIILIFSIESLRKRIL